MPRTAPTPIHRPFRLDFTPMRYRRRGLGISQKKLASAAGVHETTIYRTEINRTAPTVAQLVSIARKLGVPIYDLFEVVDTE